jgi:hypothetical protein
LLQLYEQFKKYSATIDKITKGEFTGNTKVFNIPNHLKVKPLLESDFQILSSLTTFEKPKDSIHSESKKEATEDKDEEIAQKALKNQDQLKYTQ